MTTLRRAILAFALFPGCLHSAPAQTRAPGAADATEVARLQQEIARNQAKGDYQSVALELRLLARQYKNDPAMLSITYTQLAQVSSQLHDEKKAAEYRALAQGVPTQPAPVAAPFAAPQTAAAPVGGAQVYAGPPAPTPVSAGGPAPKSSSAEKFSKFLAGTKQIIAQAQAVEQAMKAKGASTPPAEQPMPTQAGGFPAAPDAAGAGSAPQPLAAGGTDAAAQGGVVIGYDANHQPIYAPPPPPAPGGQTPAASKFPPPPR